MCVFVCVCVCVCIPILITIFPSGSAVRNHGRAYPAPCVRSCVCSGFMHAHVQFGRFDKADTSADVL